MWLHLGMEQMSEWSVCIRPEEEIGRTRDNIDTASGFELLRIDVARDVAFRARWGKGSGYACKSPSYQSGDDGWIDAID